MAVHQTSTNNYQSTKYIVDASSGPFNTIQSAINEANANGGNAVVYIRPGSYTENLTLYTTVSIEGAESTLVSIIGQHTPPTTGSLSFTRIEFKVTGTDSIIFNANAGTTSIKFTRCSFAVADGYIFKLNLWTGNLLLRYCVGGASVKNGIVYNTGGSKVEIQNSAVGAGTANAMTVSGITNIDNGIIDCPISLSGSAVSTFEGGSTLKGTITTANTVDLLISGSRIPTGSAIAITHNSSVVLKLSNVSIDTTNTYAITGTGSVKFSEATFPNSKGLGAGVVEVLTGVVKTGEIYADTVQRMVMSGFYSWAAGGPYFDDTTLGTFQLLVGGTGYIRGKLITWVAQNITGMTAGNTYFIYIDNTGTIGKATAHTDALYEDNIVLFECMRDSTGTNNQLTVAENHPYSFQTGPSNYLHDIVGTVIENVNNGANIVISGTQKIGISGDDVLSDHGVDTTITTTATVTSWLKYYTNAGGKWARQNSTDSFTGYYNNAGTPTSLGGSGFAVYTLYVAKNNLNSADPIYIAVLDTVKHASSGAASTAIANGTTARASGELALLEMAQLGYIIYRGSTNAITTVTISKSTLKATLSTGGTNTASLVVTDTTNFANILSAADTNVQSSLDTIDDMFVNIVAGTDSPQVYFKKYRAAAALTSGDLTGTVKFSGYDGTQLTDSARITSTSSGTIASTRVAGDLKFYTHPDSAAANPTLRMTISPIGAVTMATADSGTTLTVSGGGITATAGAITATLGNIVVTSGNLLLPTTSSTVGQIQINSLRHYHAYGTYNSFVGEEAGNFSLSGATNNTSIGYRSLYALTSGSYNNAVGFACMTKVTSGGYNNGVGRACLNNLTTGSYNCAVGAEAGYYWISAASYNTTIGAECGPAGNCDGSYNTVIGQYAGQGMTTGTRSHNVYIANTGANESNKMRIGTTGSGTGQQNDCWLAGTYAPTTAIGGTAKVVLIDSADHIGGLAGAANTVLLGGTAPTFGAVDLATATVTGILPPSKGGRNTISESTTSNTVAMAPNTTYVATSTNGATLVVYTLPATAAVGDIVKIVGKSTAFWSIAQNATDTIHFGATLTTPGVTGTVTTAQTWASVTLICITASSIWVITDSAGTIALA